MTITPAMSVAVVRVRRLNGDYFLCREVADALGVSTATIRRLAAQDGLLAPAANVFNGATAVAVYDLVIIERLAAHLRERQSAAGRPRLWSDAERRGRRASYSTLGHRRRRTAALREAGDHPGAELAQQLADSLGAQLQADHLQRSTQLRRGGAGPGD